MSPTTKSGCNRPSPEHSALLQLTMALALARPFSSRAVRCGASGAAIRKASVPNPNLAMTPSYA